MANMFRPATREKLKLRMALDGPSGSGKTYTALRSAFALAGDGSGGHGKVAVIDTEHRSASKYQGMVIDGATWNFDVCELEHYAPSTYTQVIRAAGAAGYAVLVIDSLSHAWEGVGGALDMVDRAGDKGGNKFTAWKDVSPMQREMIEAILASPCHVIATMRTKMEYVLEEQDRGGRKVMVPKKVGMAPIQRQGVEYEFDVVADLDASHTLVVSKSRCPAIDGARISKPDASFVEPIKRWLGEGKEPEPEPVRGFVPAVATEGEGEGSGVAPQVEREPIGDSSAKVEQASYERCDSGQRERIKALVTELKMPRDAFIAALAKRGVAKAADLTVQAANELLLSLEQVKLRRDAAGRF